MRWLNKLFGRREERRQEILKSIQTKFSIFRNLLDCHNSTLKHISSLEEKYHDRKLVGMSLVWDEFVKISGGVSEAIDKMIQLGGDKYLSLQNRKKEISDEVEKYLPINRPIARDDFTIPFDNLDRDRSYSVGTKNATLGELKSKLSLPVPEGYAISTWAYQHFLSSNLLDEKIQTLLNEIKDRNYQDLEMASQEIREAIIHKPVPDDLASALYTAFDNLAEKTDKTTCALRSSAIGEDTPYSFAGQYLSFLDVRRDTLLDSYKQIVASKFTPSAIHYLRSHSLTDMDFGMGVVCMEVVDAAASGVVYTVDPLDPDSSQMVVNSIFGFGKYLVDGTLNPDILRISRSDKAIIFSRNNPKPVQLRLNSEGKIESIPVPDMVRNNCSIDSKNLDLLIDYSLKIERHLGGPQDIEWAIDGSGKLFILQARHLYIWPNRVKSNIPIEAQSLILQSGGIPICPGIGTGRIFHITSVADFGDVPHGAILVAPNPSPHLVAVMHKISALITVVGGNTSHLASLARELGVPTIVNMKDAQKLEKNREVTVDAGQGIIYDGSHPEWTPPLQNRVGSETDNPYSETIKNMLFPIVHLNVIHPSDPAFTSENCKTFHDLLRYVHQKSMEEIFLLLRGTSNKDKIGLRLKTKIPLIINIIYLDQNFNEMSGRRWVGESDIQSLPMQALWSGVLEEGWQQTPVPADLRGFVAVIGADLQGGHKPEFSEFSYAFLSREYMLLNLRMGYHFSTIESIVTPEPAKNYVRMQFKLGGAPLERRIRRIWLIGEILRKMGFENSSEGDFLDSMSSYQSEEETFRQLRLLGRITILTKQLDMTLSSDAKTRWYLKHFLEKLNLNSAEN